MEKKLFEMLAFLLLVSSAFSQSLAVFGVDPSGFPTIKAKFFAFDASGNQITNISNSDLEVKENGQLRSVTSVSCPPVKPQMAISSVLTIDVSGSMSGNGLSIAKEAANVWINMLALGKSECAVTTFDQSNYINQDFTTDRNKLLTAINNLKIGGGTDYDYGLLLAPSGSLVISKAGTNKRVVVFLSDGVPNKEPLTNQIIAEANRQNCAIYSVIIGMKCPKYLQDISNQTGGLWFENIVTEEDAKNVYQKILMIAQGGDPCTIEWLSGIGCISYLTNAEIKLIPYNLSANTNYQAPNNSIASLEFSPTFLSFKNIAPGKKADAIVKVTARIADYNITNITSSNPAYSINNTSFALPKDQSIELTVSFTPTDSGYSFTKFSFESNVCPANLYSSGGYTGKKPKSKTLNLTIPNGGEEFVAGSDTIITWEGIPETDIVQLEYSIDDGATWHEITDSASGLKYLWQRIPMPASKKCKVRVKQGTNNNSTGIKLPPGTLQFDLGGHISSLTDISWSPDGKLVATASLDNTAIIWDAANGSKIHTLRGHTADVNNVCWNPSSTRLATASDDKTAIIWDATNGAKLQTLKGHTAYVNNVCWNFDGTRIATSSVDNTAIIWYPVSGNKIHTLSGHISNVSYVSWSPDGKLVATASADNTAIIWDAGTGSLIHILNGHTDKLYHLSWSPDGSRIATASADHYAIIWDADNGVLLHKLSGHTYWVNNVNWSPDGKRLVTASTDKTAIIWDATSGAILHTLSGHTGSVNNAIWSPDGKEAITLSYDNNAIIWDADSGKVLHTLTGHTNLVTNASWSPDGKRVATSSYDNRGIIWDATTGVSLYELGGHTNAVNNVIWSPDGSRFATESNDHTAIIWDASTGGKLHVLTKQAFDISDVTWSPDGTRVATICNNKSVIIWDALTGAILRTIDGYISDISWSPDGTRLATAQGDKTAIIWDAASGTKLQTLTGHTGYVSCVSWSPDGIRLATSANDNTVIIWDAASGSIIRTLNEHGDWLNNVSWSPDGNRVATSNYSNTVIIWDAASGAKLQTLTGHISDVNSCWNTDGSRLATLAYDKTAMIWDAASGVKVLTLTGHTSNIINISWSPDGDRIATSSGDKTAIIWDAFSGVILYTLTGHTGGINNVTWSPYGNRVATASVDNTAKIWIVGNSIAVLQEDESDNVFSIIAPKAQAIDIDMGQCLLGSAKDSLIQAFVNNIGTYKLTVDSIYFSGTDASAFQLVSGMPPYQLAPGANKGAEFRFAPKKLGINTATINIITQSDTLKQTITGEGIQPQLQILSNIIDFGAIKVGKYKDTLQVLTIKNIGSAPITITNTKHNKPNDIDFTTISGGGSFTLQPNETRKMDLRFKPSDNGRTSGILEFHYNGFSSPAIVQLYGQGIKLKTRITTNSPLCEGDDLYLFTDSIQGAQFFWSGPDGFKSNQQNPIIKNAKTSQSGTYYQYATIGATTTDTNEIEILINTSLVSPGDSSLIFVGSAAKIDNFIKLTDAKEWDGGSIWLKNRFSVKQNFATTFKFRTRFGNNNGADDGSLPGADGLAFVMQNHNYPVLGDKGGSMGYTGITNSLAIEFDLFKNSWDTNGNHIAVQSMGSQPNIADHNVAGSCMGINDKIITVKQDSIYYAKIEYDWTTKSLSIYLDSTNKHDSPALTIPNINLASYLQLEEGEYVYIGFTSGTGMAYQEHDIFDWTIPCKNQLVGVEEKYVNISNSDELIISPNPSNEYIFISHSNRRLQPSATEADDIRIYNVLGEMVKKPHPSSPQGAGVRIDVSGLPPGLYYCTVSSGMNRITKSFAVVR